MPTVYPLFPDTAQQWLDRTTGDLLSGGQLFIYVAGSSTKATSYTTSAGDVANANPIVLNSGGALPNGVYVESGSYKWVLASSTESDPPASSIASADNLTPANDVSAGAASEWTVSLLTPTFISATSFSVVGDHRSDFHVGRRVRAVVSGGTRYGEIIGNSFSTNTDVYLKLDSGSLDSGISTVSLGLVSASDTSAPRLSTPFRRCYGLELSIGTDTSHDIQAATGAIDDSTGVYVLELTSTLNKDMDAVFAAGDNNGGNHSGALTADTWYHVFLIRNDTTGAIDMYGDISISAANIPSGYTAYAYRNSFLTDATSNIIAFHMYGDYTYWDLLQQDFDSASLAVAGQNITLSVPPDREVMAHFRAYVSDPTGAAHFYSPNTTGEQPSGAIATPPGYDIEASTDRGSFFQIVTNTSSQIVGRASSGGSNIDCDIYTLGFWNDPTR